MEINGKIHCFFEQSGTFKNEFKKLGVCDKDVSSEIASKIHALKEYSVTEIRWLYKSDQVTIMVYEREPAREKIKEILNEYKD